MNLRGMLLVAIGLTALGPACADEGQDSANQPMPGWVEAVYPEPGATVAVPDAVEVDHAVQGSQEDVRLVIDGVDVTTYSSFEAAKIRYESGAGPIELGDRQHTAEALRVRLLTPGADFQVLDSFTWEFTTG